MKDTKRLAKIAILSAISFLLMIFPQFPLIPGVDFLKVEFSIIPILVGYYLMDLNAAYMILFIRSLLKLFINNEGVSTWIGLPMNIVAIASFITIFALINGRTFTKVKFVMAGTFATIGMTLSMMLMNYVYAIPLYSKFANFNIKDIFGVGNYLLTMVMPFNILQGFIFTGAFAVFLLASKHVMKTQTSHNK